jgi:hypothetical protein
MRQSVQGQFRLTGVGLLAAFLLLIGVVAWLGVETSQLDALKNELNNLPPQPICRRLCHDGLDGPPGSIGLNGTCPTSTCLNGTNGTDGAPGLLLVTIQDAEGNVLDSFFSEGANLTIIINDNDTAVVVPGPPGPQGPNGTNGLNGTQGPAGVNGTNGVNGLNGTAGSNGLNGTCTTTCTNGQNGTNGQAGANGVVQVTAFDCNSSQTVSFNATNPLLTIVVPNNSSVVSLSGTPGTNGTNGLNGTNGVNGVNGINGTNGVNGVNGVNGTNGVNGVNGTNGINGRNGTDGTSCSGRIGMGSINSQGASGATTACTANTNTLLNGMTTSGALVNFTRVGGTLVYVGTTPTTLLVLGNVGFSYSVATTVYVLIAKNAAFVAIGGPVTATVGGFESLGTSFTVSAATGDVFKLAVQAGLTGTITNYQSSLSAISL